VVVAECVVVLRQLLQQNAYNTNNKVSVKILHQLVKLLIIEGGIENDPLARSSIVWLVGEFHQILSKVAPDILRILASGFTGCYIKYFLFANDFKSSLEESTETKTQILNLAVKQSLHLPDNEKIQLLMTYILEMSRYDTDTDLRDRSRFMTALMGLAPSSSSDSHSANEDALAELNEHAKVFFI
jgi:AP-3 complex subunit beta